MKRKGKNKKLNNKGFAISSVLYSLVIMVFLIVTLMMGMMASNRRNTHKLVDQIEEELNRYSLSSTTLEFDTSATTAVPQEYIVPTGQSGWYKIELWGASGGSTVSETGVERKGGKGSYTSGIVYLEENETLYFYIGGTTTTSTGGLNGGGDGGSATGKGGGGSTDVRTVNGTWDQQNSLQSRFMVAAGGGGADGLGAGSAGGSGGQIYGDSGAVNKDSSDYTIAGAGKQIGPTISSFLNISTTVKNCNRAHYTDEDNKELSGCGRLGEGGSSPISRTNGGGGGSGYFGGGAGTNNKSDVAGSGAGGSSFIAGFGGTIEKDPEADSSDIEEQNDKIYYTGDKMIIEGKMVGDINEGNGYAKIELVSQADKDNKPQRKNSNLDSVRYIRDCTTGTTETKTEASWIEIQANANGTNLAAGKTPTLSGTTTSTSGSLSSITDENIDASNAFVAKKAEDTEICVAIDLGTTRNLDEIFVLHRFGESSSSMQYKHKLETSSNGSTWKTVKKYGSTAESHISIPEQTSGYRYTAWNVDNNTSEIPNGVYYIESTLSPKSRALTAANNNQSATDNTGTSGRHVSLSTLKSSGVQKWAITKLNDGYYKIVEIESNNALQIKDNLGQKNTAVNTASAYSDSYDWTKWKIISLGDGTYRIQAKVGSNYLSTINNNFYADSDIQIAEENTSDATFTQRWIFSYALY